MKTFHSLFFVFALLILGCGSSDDETPGPMPSDPVKVSISNISADEGNGFSNVTVELTLDVAADEPVTANVSTNEGTAESNKDFVPVSNLPVVFSVGQTSQTFNILIVGDFIFEDDEFFEVTISSVAGPATIDVGTARVDIINDDVMAVQGIPVDLTVDWDVLLNLAPGSEPPYEVMNFGQPANIPNAEFTSVASLSDTITFSPRFSQNGDTILYFELTFDPGFEPADYFEDLSELVNPDDSVFTEAKLVVINNESSDLETKYNLWFYIGRVTGERVGPYLIDPKIRIPSQ